MLLLAPSRYTHGEGYKKHEFDSEILLGAEGELFVLSSFPRFSLYQIGQYDLQKLLRSEGELCALDTRFDESVRVKFALEKLAFYDILRPQLELYLELDKEPIHQFSFQQAISQNFRPDFLLKKEQVAPCSKGRLLSIFQRL